MTAAIFNESGLIRGLCYSKASTTRAHCLMLSVQNGTAKTSKTYTLNKVDFDAQYMQAVTDAAKIFGMEGSEMALYIGTRDRFVRKYGINLKRVEMMVAI